MSGGVMGAGARRTDRRRAAGAAWRAALAAALAVALALPAAAQGAWAATTGTDVSAGRITMSWGTGDNPPSGVWSEGVLTVDGEWVYCAAIDAHFENGVEVSAEDPVATGRWSQDMVTELALASDFIWAGKFRSSATFGDGHMVTGAVEKYAIAQKYVWAIMNSHGFSSYGWFGAEVAGTGLTGADDGDADLWAYVNANKGSYIGHANYYDAGSAQSVVCGFWVEPATGDLKLVKKALLGAIVKNNRMYSLEGAEYTVTDSSGKKVGTITTDAGGKGELAGLAAGTYRVKETKAPKGYTLDGAVHEVTVEAGQEATFMPEEVPLSDPVPVRVQKLDALTGKPDPQGAGTLGGAEFTFRYYDGLYSSVDELPSARRTWVMRTNDDGYAFLALGDAMKASGDAFYKDLGGNIVVPLGTLTVTETKAPAGYRLADAEGNPPKTFVMQIRSADDGNTKTKLVRKNFEAGEYEEQGNVRTARASDDPKRGNLKLVKTDRDTADGTAQGAATLAGARFEVVNANDNPVRSPQSGADVAKGGVVCTIVTAADGVASTADAEANGWAIPAGWGGKALVAGRYTVREASPPEGYLPDGEWSATVAIADDGQVAVASLADVVARGDFELAKRDRDTRAGNAQGAATLAGARFEIVNRNEAHVTSPETGADVAPGGVVCTVTTDADGFASTKRADLNGWAAPDGWDGALAYGSYTAREAQAPEGYLPDTAWHADFAVGGQGQVLSSAAADVVKRGNAEIVKRDSASRSGKAQGAATLAGAEYEIVNMNSQVVVSPQTGDEVARGGVVCTVTTDADGFASTAREDLNGWAIPGDWDGKALAYGTYLVRESAPSEGYLLNSKWSATVVIDEDGRVVRHGTTEDVKRGDLSFTKVHERSMRRLAGVPFLITSKATGEAHVAVSDDNGTVSTANSWNPHGQRTNANDAAVDAGGAVDESKLDPEAGIWFEGRLAREGAPVDEALGALPYDTYEVRELPCAANGGLVPVTFDVRVYRHAVDLDQGTVDDHAKPAIGTSLADAEGTRTVPADASVALTDEVSYSNFDEGTYTFKGELHLASAAGADMGVVASSQKAARCTGSGSVEVVFMVDASALEPGSRLVAFERCYDEAGNAVAEHADLEDEMQTVRVPSIGTELSDAADGDHELPSCGAVTLTDHVAYTGLTPGKAYTARMALHRKAADGTDAGEVLDASGNPVTASASFTPAEPDGSVDVTATFEVADGGGYDAVAFEELVHRDTAYAFHADIADESQTVTLPKVSTAARDEATGARVLRLQEEGSPLAVVDAIAYEGLAPGAEYAMAGEVHVRGADGADLGALAGAGGAPVAAQEAFSPEAAAGSLEMRFEADAQVEPGTTLVVFERLYRVRDGARQLVAEHADIGSAEQSLRSPSIRTTAADGATGSHYASSTGAVTIVDTVAYENLEPGAEYAFAGSVHLVGADGGDGGEVEGARARAAVVPAAPDGSVELSFELPGGIEPGRKAVVFERVEAGGVAVAAHEDPADEAQQVLAARIGTTATDKATGSHFAGSTGKVTVVDEVSYENLEPGVEHVMRASAHRVGEGGSDAGEVAGASSETAFTPAAPNGSVKVEIELDGEALAGEKVVVFERAERDGAAVAAHEDPADEAQQVDLAKVGTTARDKASGKHEGKAADSATVVDAVAYAGLEPGAEYRLSGVLYDKDTGKPFEDGNGKVASEKAFEPADGAGTVEVEFPIEGAVLDGARLVVFETLYDADGNPVAEHADIDSADQTVSYKAPDILDTVSDTFDKTGYWLAQHWWLLVIAGCALLLVGSFEYMASRKSVFDDGGDAAGPE